MAASLEAGFQGSNGPLDNVTADQIHFLLFANVTPEESQFSKCLASYDVILVLATGAALLALLAPTILYNLYYFKLLLSNRQSEAWMRIMLLNLTACTVLDALSTTLIVLYNMTADSRLLDSSSCHWVDIPTSAVHVVHLLSVGFISVVLLQNSCVVKLTWLNRKRSVVGILAFIWIATMAGETAYKLSGPTHAESDCFCHQVLTSNHVMLFVRYAIELAVLGVATANFCYVYRRSRTKVLDMDTADLCRNLKERVQLWKTATNARSVLPWAITHVTYKAFILIVSNVVVVFHESVPWRYRISMTVAITSLNIIDILIQPLILIRSSYSFTNQVKRLPSFFPRLFIPGKCSQQLADDLPGQAGSNNFTACPAMPVKKKQMNLDDLWVQEQKRAQKRQKSKRRGRF